MDEGVTCPACGGSNSGDQGFCGSCGAELVLACSSCGRSNPPSYTFCGGCGGALREPSRSRPAEERRWATTLFADLSGFTPFSERTDPEDVREMIDRCMARLGEIVDRYGGTSVQVTGDELMALFGAPTAHDDDPERAVRAALEMQACAREHTDEFGGLEIRIGVNTGEIMFAPVGPGDTRRFTAMGDATNVASRLETAAPLGGVLVGGETFQATKHAIGYDEIEPVRAKGKDEPVPAWLAREPVAEPADRRISEVPILGRDRELDLLRGTWKRVLEERRPHLVTILGPPGIGKSKLAREFVTSIDGAQAVWGRSFPYGERAGGAFGQIVRQVADAYVTDDTATAHRKLESAVRRLVDGGEAELTQHLAAIIGLGTGDDVERSSLFGAARTFVEALAEREPTILAFEDLQWADTSLLELVQWLATRVRHVPLLLLVLTRPEMLDDEPGWAGGMTGYTALPLGPLSTGHARELASRLRTTLDEATLDRIEQAAGGNPLFIEELAAWVAEEHDTSRPLPATITSIVAARLDALPGRLRRVILDASVIGLSGLSFWRGSLEALSDDGDLEEALDELEARDLVRRRRTSRLPGETEYAFRHELIRDVAYEILPRAVRRERHAAVARYIEARLGESTPLVAGILANHWVEAGDAGRGIDYLIEAADVAARGWEQQEAIRLLRQARSLLEPGDTARKREINLKLAIARSKLEHSILDAPKLREEAGDRPKRP